MSITGRMRFSVCLLLFGSLTVGFADSPRRRLKLIETGQFHSEEIMANTGQRWLGLFIKGRRAVLRYSTIRVRTVFDDVTDFGTRNETGKKVSVSSSPEPMFLLRHAPGLSAGPVTSLFKASVDFERTLDKIPVRLKLGKKSYVLKVVAPDKNPSPCRESAFFSNARLVLVSGNKAQTLYTLDGCGNDPYWYLLWAGDLDRDGKLDLYVSVTQHYDVSERKLFLSSRARKGRMVKEVAAFVTGGC